MLRLAGFCGVYSGCVEEGCGDCRRNDRVLGSMLLGSGAKAECNYFCAWRVR